jgi:hypothetical protein
LALEYAAIVTSALKWLEPVVQLENTPSWDLFPALLMASNILQLIELWEVN